eukprot:12168-Heterococcus_DN1.PRE.1
MNTYTVYTSVVPYSIYTRFLVRAFLPLSALQRAPPRDEERRLREIQREREREREKEQKEQKDKELKEQKHKAEKAKKKALLDQQHLGLTRK